MNFDKIHRVYFLGIGGIGMSALARYFQATGKQVAGYDRTPTKLTQELESIGMNIHYDDDCSLIPEDFKQKQNTLIVRTPAVPVNHTELNYFLDEAYTIKKRAEVLGIIFNSKKGIAVAGTHGKTTVSTMVSYLLKETGIGCNAFLGGISKNYLTNLLIDESDYVVAEADEFDRSFLQLNPNLALITAIDPDHLDIYNDHSEIENSFLQFIGQIDADGVLIFKKGLDLKIDHPAKQFTYSLNDTESDFYASDIRIENNRYFFTAVTPFGEISNLSLEHPGLTNVENAIAAIALVLHVERCEDKIQQVLSGFKGILRRFDLQLSTDKVVYMDDYAHHPRELDAVIGSVKKMYPGRQITGIFQPHLYSRTRDFAEEFAQSLSKLDQLLLMDIYPAREELLPGVDADLIFQQVNIERKLRCSKENLINKLKGLNIEVLITLGAGDIDQFVGPITDLLKAR